jgi:hypothetical protein
VPQRRFHRRKGHQLPLLISELKHFDTCTQVDPCRVWICMLYNIGPIVVTAMGAFYFFILLTPVP